MLLYLFKYSKVKTFAVIIFSPSLLPVHLADNTMKVRVHHTAQDLCLWSYCIDVLVLLYFGPFDWYWCVILWCDSHSDLPARINEAAKPEEQADQQGGEPGPQAHPNGHHSGGSRTGAKCTHVGSPLKYWYRIQRVYTMGRSSLSLDNSPAWDWGRVCYVFTCKVSGLILHSGS